MHLTETHRALRPATDQGQVLQQRQTTYRVAKVVAPFHTMDSRTGIVAPIQQPPNTRQSEHCIERSPNRSDDVGPCGPATGWHCPSRVEVTARPCTEVVGIFLQPRKRAFHISDFAFQCSLAVAMSSRWRVHNCPTVTAVGKASVTDQFVWCGLTQNHRWAAVT